MSQATQPISPLRQRMIEDMNLRKFAPITQDAYIRAVKKLGLFLGHSPHIASKEDLRLFQLYLVDKGTSDLVKHFMTTQLSGFSHFN